MPVENSVVKNEGANYEPLPEGLYNVQIVDIVELKDVDRGKYGKADMLRFYMGVLDETQRGEPVWQRVTKSYTSGWEGGSSSKLYDLACAVYGEELNDEEALDVNTLIEGRLKVLVKHSKSNGRTYANVVEVMKATPQDKALPELTDDERLKIMPKEKEEVSDEEIDDITQAMKEDGDLDNLDLDSVDFDTL